MLIVNTPRTLFYDLAQKALSAFVSDVIAIEVGVLRGENADEILNRLMPAELYLVDTWSSAVNADYISRAALRPWMRPIESFSRYYGGDVRLQRTYDELYAHVLRRFENNNSVRLFRGGLKEFSEKYGKLQPNFAYVDAAHAFEDVFDDVVLATSKLANHAFLQLNDCAHSKAAIAQNCGVLEAVSRFLKVDESWVPIAITNSDMADLIIGRRDSPVTARLVELVKSVSVTYASSSGPLKYVDLPDFLLPTLRVDDRGNLRFG
jgi:hypothetical protein